MIRFSDDLIGRLTSDQAEVRRLVELFRTEDLMARYTPNTLLGLVAHPAVMRLSPADRGALGQILAAHFGWVPLRVTTPIPPGLASRVQEAVWPSQPAAPARFSSALFAALALDAFPQGDWI